MDQQDRWYGQEATFAQWEEDNGWMPPETAPLSAQIRLVLSWALIIGGCVLVWWAIGVAAFITFRGVF